MKRLIILALSLSLMGCASVSKHLWGYEKSVYVDDIETLDYYLYLDVQGLDPSPYWKLPTVQERAFKLAEKQYGKGNVYQDIDGWYYVVVGGQAQRISCSPQGRWLYVGVDPEWW